MSEAASVVRTLRLGGDTFVADQSGALYWPAGRTLIVADLHLEKGSAFAVRGAMLPPYDSRETLGKLALAIARHAPERVLALGDSLHDTGGAARLGEDELGLLHRLQAGRSWIWLLGNHDPEIGPRLGGQVETEIALGPFTCRHIPSCEGATLELAGHFHPVARVALGATVVRRRCFAWDASTARLVLPAFGALTGGLNVLDEAMGGIFSGGLPSVMVIGDAGVYPIASGLLTPDRG